MLLPLNYTHFKNIAFPIFFLPHDELIYKDGLLLMDELVLDDKNKKEASLGIRRLKCNFPLLPLKKGCTNLIGMIKSNHKYFIDNNGLVFEYKKTKFIPLKYHKIDKVKKLSITSILFCRDLTESFIISIPPRMEQRYAGILYNNHPWLWYEYSQEKKKDTKRKI